jgi:hypothetical protein
MIRSGRIRSDAATRSSALTCASPSALRAASRPMLFSCATESSGGVLDQDQPLVRRHLAQQGVEEGGLAGRRAARDEDVLARLDRGREQAGDVALVELRRERAVDLGTKPASARAFVSAKAPAGDIVAERQIGRDVLADGDRDGPARRRRRHHLDSGAVGQGGGEQRMLAADPLVRERGDLAGEAGEGRFVEPRRLVPLDGAAGRLDPQLAGPVDVDVGDVGPREHAGQRREIGAEIDARSPSNGTAADALTFPARCW